MYRQTSMYDFVFSKRVKVMRGFEWASTLGDALQPSNYTVLKLYLLFK